MAVSLREVVNRRIVDDMIRAVRSWKVMITDEKALKILSKACKMNDIMEEDVTLIEGLEKRRQPYADLAGVYFCTPTEASVDLIIQDFSTKPLYASAHLFFTSGLSDELFAKIKNSKLYKYVKNCKELYVEFLAMEGQVYSFNRAKSFQRLYSPDARDINREVDIIAKQLVSLCATLDEDPIVRYSTLYPGPGGDLTKRIASAVQRKVDDYVEVTGFKQPKDRPRAILLVLDRSFDLQTPILHEFTYQAMSNDLLDIEDGCKYKYDYETTKGSESKEAILDDQDHIWVKYRHRHIAETNAQLTKDLSDFLAENKAATGGKATGLASLGELKEVISALPQFQETKAKFSVHLSMAAECMRRFEKSKLKDVAMLEQNIATGYGVEGEEIRNIIIDMLPVLEDDRVRSKDKLRLLMLYIVSREGGISDMDRRKLFNHARLRNDHVNALRNISLLGIKLSSANAKLKAKSDKRYKKCDFEFDISRYLTQMKILLEAYMAGDVDPVSYPYVRAADVSAETESSTEKKVVSLRSAKPNWQNAGNKNSSLRKGPTEDLTGGSRIIIFVTGGVTYSEIRDAYEMTKVMKRQVIIGSTHIITPSDFVEQVCRLQGGRRSTSRSRVGEDGGGSPKSRSQYDYEDRYKDRSRESLDRRSSPGKSRRSSEGLNRHQRGERQRRDRSHGRGDSDEGEDRQRSRRSDHRRPSGALPATTSAPEDKSSKSSFRSKLFKW